MSSYAITGAARGIGFELVNQLSVDPNNHVFALVRTAKNAQELKDLNRPNVHIIEADITNIPLIKKAAKTVSEITGGKLDVLINNAVWSESVDEQSRSLLDYEGEEDRLAEIFNNSFNVNIVGTVNATNAFVPLLRAGNSKKILTLSSGRGDLPMNVLTNDPTAVPYCTSKYAINFVVAKYAIALKSEGFTCLAVSPGLVATNNEELSPDNLAKVMEMIKTFQTIYPEWDGKPISPETSVNMVLKVLKNAGPERSGEFLSHHGTQQWL